MYELSHFARKFYRQIQFHHQFITQTFEGVGPSNFNTM